VFAPLGEDGDGVVTAEALSVPSGGSGVVGDIGMFAFERLARAEEVGGVNVVGEFGAVAAGEPKLPWAQCFDVKFAVVVGVVMAGAE
jgi:hypothetical protein